MEIKQRWFFKYGQEIREYNNGQFEYCFNHMRSIHYHWIEARSKVQE